MNAEMKAKWVAALRSGKYQPGNSYLRSEAGWSCLGVLCDIIDNSKWERHGDGILTDHYWKFAGQSWFLPNAILHEQQLDPFISPIFTLEKNGKLFAEIGDWIEQHIPTGAP